MTNLIDERSYQNEFYHAIFGDEWENIINVGHSTDGYTKHVLFEHKPNVSRNGITKTLGQALLYLVKFNREGIPVPGTIMLVSQEERKMYIFDSTKYINIIDNISEFGQRSASSGIDVSILGNTEPDQIIEYSLSAMGREQLRDEIEECNTNCKVHINIFNVVGWSKYYYATCKHYGFKDTKTDFFKMLEDPKSFMSSLIYKWEGKEEDFSYVLDELNDPKMQKKLGAFYTPSHYAAKAADVLRSLISRYKENHPDDDYLIIDRCAGSGNLEVELTDEELSHCILNTYEVKEWKALRDRIGRQVRMIIPPIIEGENEPANNNGVLSGSDALSKAFCDKLKKAIEECKTTDTCAIFFFENPPYGENGSHATQNGLEEEERGQTAWWKTSYVYSLMKEDIQRKGISGQATNDMGHLFIWSAFNIFMSNEYDGAVFFNPIKYWSSQKLVNKEIVDKFICKSIDFHTTSTFPISVIGFSNIDSDIDEIEFPVYEINDNKMIKTADTKVKRGYKTLSETLYDHRDFEDDEKSSVYSNYNGYEIPGDRDFEIRTDNVWNSNMVAYMVSSNKQLVNQWNFTCGLTTTPLYGGNGFILREDNFEKKLPGFAAGIFPCYNSKWYLNNSLSKTGDGYERYCEDVAAGKLDNWLMKVLILTCLTDYNHTHSFYGSNNKFYINRLALCQNTIADARLAEYEYEFDDEEKELIRIWQLILNMIKETEEYKKEYVYGLHQIINEIDISIEVVEPNGNTKKIAKYSDLHNVIKEFKKKLSDYYNNQISRKLFRYEFIK